MHCFQDLSTNLTGAGSNGAAHSRTAAELRTLGNANRGGQAGQSEGAADGTEPAQLVPPAQPARGNRLERPAYRYGNFPRYYGYRVGQTLEDPRMLVLKQDWCASRRGAAPHNRTDHRDDIAAYSPCRISRCRFSGKRALDIGTNEGLIPLSVAVKYLTASFDGIDIDNDLVHKARCPDSRQDGQGTAFRRCWRAVVAWLAHTHRAFCTRSSRIAHIHPWTRSQTSSSHET